MVTKLTSCGAEIQSPTNLTLEPGNYQEYKKWKLKKRHALWSQTQVLQRQIITQKHGDRGSNIF